MTLVIELTPEEERRLQSARARGIDPAAILKGILASLPPDDAPGQPRRTSLEIARSYTGPRRTKDQIDKDIESERQAWDR